MRVSQYFRCILPQSRSRETISPAREVTQRNLSPVDLRNGACTSESIAQLAVLDPANTEINPRGLARLVGGLIRAIPLESDRGNAENGLIRELRRLGDLVEGGTLSSSELGLKLRDGFASASQEARRLARSIPSRDPNAKQLALTYRCYSALFTELKRIHLTAAAPHVMDEYVQRKAATLKKLVPTIGDRVSGSNIISNRRIGADHAFGPGTLGGALGANRFLLIDDDTETNFWKTYGGYAYGGVGGKLARWGGKLTGKLGLEGSRTYFETESLEDTLRLVANLDANQSPQRSAGPNHRKGSRTFRSIFNQFAKNALGRNYEPPAGAPSFLHDKKLTKGYNYAKLNLIALALDELTEGHSLSELIAAAYPSAASVARVMMECDAPLPENPIHRTVPLSEPFCQGLVGIKNVSAGAKAFLGKSSARNGLVEGEMGVSIEGNWNTMQIDARMARFSHEILDPAHHRDLAQTLKLHRQLESHSGGAARNGGSPRLFLYEKMKRELQGNEAEGPSRVPWEGCDEDCYGGIVSISRGLLEAISSPDSAKLRAAASACKRLSADYLSFLDDAARVMAKRDRRTPTHLVSALERERLEAFQRINDRIWNGAYPGGSAKALKDPRKLVAQSHDAAGLALGYAGIYLAVLKREMSTRPHLQTQENLAAIEQADSAYHDARQLLDRAYLPMKKEAIASYGIFEEAGLWRKHICSGKATARMGADLGFLSAATKGKANTPGAISITNEAGQVVLSGEATYQNQVSHPNGARVGQFVVLNLTLTGGAPLLGAHLRKGVLSALKKVYRGADVAQVEHHASDIVRQLQGVVLDQTDGVSIVLKLRKAPGGQKYQVQYLRVLANKDSGFRATVPIPTPTGIVNLNLSTTDSVQSTMFEVAGPDLGYLVLQHKKLLELLEKENRSPSSSLSDLFMHDGRMKNRYFGFSSTIVDVVKEYVHFREALEPGGGAAPGRQAASEFFRFNSQEPFKRVGAVASEVAKIAPGSTRQGHDVFEPQPNALQEVGRLPSMLEIERAGEHVKTLKTVDDRLAYFCGEGRFIFDAFTRIVTATRRINSAAMMRVASSDMAKTGHGFRTKLDVERLQKEARSATASRGSTNMAREALGSLGAGVPEEPGGQEEVFYDCREDFDEPGDDSWKSRTIADVLGEFQGGVSGRAQGALRLTTQQRLEILRALGASEPEATLSRDARSRWSSLFRLRPVRRGNGSPEGASQ